MVSLAIQRAACSGKKVFQTPQLAFKALSRNKTRPDDRDFYRCQCCGGFHIGGRRKALPDE